MISQPISLFESTDFDIRIDIDNVHDFMVHIYLDFGLSIKFKPNCPPSFLKFWKLSQNQGLLLFQIFTIHNNVPLIFIIT